MTMQRWDVTPSAGMQRMVGGRFVVASDAEAAITSALADDRAILARAENAWREEIRLRLHEQYEQGQRDMLAKCIAAVEALDVCWYVDDSCQSANHGILNDVYLALRALAENA